MNTWINQEQIVIIKLFHFKKLIVYFLVYFKEKLKSIDRV